MLGYRSRLPNRLNGSSWPTPPDRGMTDEELQGASTNSRRSTRDGFDSPYPLAGSRHRRPVTWMTWRDGKRHLRSRLTSGRNSRTCCERIRWNASSGTLTRDTSRSIVNGGIYASTAAGVVSRHLRQVMFDHHYGQSLACRTASFTTVLDKRRDCGRRIDAVQARAEFHAECADCGLPLPPEWETCPYCGGS